MNRQSKADIFKIFILCSLFCLSSCQWVKRKRYIKILSMAGFKPGAGLASLVNWNLHSRQKNALKIYSRPDSRDEMVLQIRTVKEAFPKKKYSFPKKKYSFPKINTPLLSQHLWLYTFFKLKRKWLNSKPPIIQNIYHTWIDLKLKKYNLENSTVFQFSFSDGS